MNPLLKILGCLALGVLAILAIVLAVQHAWNVAVVHVTRGSVPEITAWQAF